MDLENKFQNEMLRFKELHERTREILGPTLALRRQIAEIERPWLELQKKFDELMRPNNALQEQIEKAIAPIQELQERLDALVKLPSNFAAPYPDFAHQRARSLARLEMFGTEHAAYVKRIHETIDGLNAHRQVKGGGKATLALDAGEQVATDFTELSAAIARTRTVGETLDVLLQYAAGPTLAVAIFVWRVIFALLLSWVANQIPNVGEMKELLGLTHREAVKLVRASPPPELTEEQRHSLRFIAAPDLSVHGAAPRI
ncbi:hypothetical protein UC34_04940 [Pandoraea vervacti]|uniref:Uncharacterized protein n=1 Tax=Pandoraea vervacti TaxID=656178 RepID=A0ABN4FLS2_9BURK|nr:hypothetical protein [Pandoraea vervacti]AJP56528.1 hypothetical protein UC34_04940 [Pandoraea vervacti]